MYGVVRGHLFVIENFQYFVKMDKDQWMHDSITYGEVDMNEQNEDKASVNEEHVDCFDAFNISQVLTCMNYIVGVCYP